MILTRQVEEARLDLFNEMTGGPDEDDLMDQAEFDAWLREGAKDEDDRDKRQHPDRCAACRDRVFAPDGEEAES